MSRMKLTHLSLATQLNSKWIKDTNAVSESLITLRTNRGHSLGHRKRWGVLGHDSKSTETNKWEFIKWKKVCTQWRNWLAEGRRNPQHKRIYLQAMDLIRRRSSKCIRNSGSQRQKTNNMIKNGGLRGRCKSQHSARTPHKTRMAVINMTSAEYWGGYEESWKVLQFCHGIN